MAEAAVTGLGLAISRRFCRIMGGDITVASELSGTNRLSEIVPEWQLSPSASRLLSLRLAEMVASSG